MRKVAALSVMVLLLAGASDSLAYLMQSLTYEELFQRADVVVIATPLESKQADRQLAVKEQPEEVRKLLVTVDTEFQVAYALKGESKGKTLHLLHLNRKGPEPRAMVFGAVGTFFVDFERKENKGRSFILFLKREPAGHFIPAWRLMEGSRAMIPVPKDGNL